MSGPQLGLPGLAQAQGVASPAWPAYLVALCTVVALALAVVALRFAATQAQRTREEAAEQAERGRSDAARDRRLQFELTVLAEMSRQHDITGLQHLHGYTRALIRSDADEQDLPLLRALVDVHPTDAGRAKLKAVDADMEAQGAGVRSNRDGLRSRAVGREIEEAIDRRTA